jgi:enoyl-CoA hydratase
MLMNLIYEKKAGFGIVTINRPSVRNALNSDTMRELRTVFEEIGHDSDVRVAILTGSGEKAFAAGADINELARLSPVEGSEYSLTGQSTLALIDRLGKPVIAAVNGFALGGGCELAMACTFRIASDRAAFGQPEVKLGLIPGYAGSQRLPRLVGKGRAMEILLTGELITAAEALRIGLVNRVVPQSELLQIAEEIAKKIMANAPLAVKFCLDAVNQGLNMAQDQGAHLESTLFGLCCATEDMKEGTRAFLEKRPPHFKAQ